MRLLRIIAAVLLFAGSASCVSAGPPFMVDDPATVEHNRFNLIAVYMSSQVNGSETQAFPSMTLAYGLRDNIELGVGFGYLSSRSSGAPRVNGWQDTTLYAKWRFHEETRHTPQFALGYQIKFPTADPNKGLGTGSTDHTLWLSSAKTWNRYQLFANVGHNFLGNGTLGTNNWFYGVGLTYQATETLIVGGQLYGNALNAPGGSEELAWGFGLTYNYSPNKALLLQIGRSERGNSDLNVYAGISLTF